VVNKTNQLYLLEFFLIIFLDEEQSAAKRASYLVGKRGTYLVGKRASYLVGRKRRDLMAIDSTRQ
jgi:hypothetical protein